MDDKLNRIRKVHRVDTEPMVESDFFCTKSYENMLSKIEIMNKRRRKKRKLHKIEMNKRVDRLTITRHGTQNKFNNRIAKLTKECGDDGHGKYKSDYYSIPNIDRVDIGAIINPKSHSCDYQEIDCCYHNKYKATDEWNYTIPRM